MYVYICVFVCLYMYIYSNFFIFFYQHCYYANPCQNWTFQCFARLAQCKERDGTNKKSDSCYIYIYIGSYIHTYRYVCVIIQVKGTHWACCVLNYFFVNKSRIFFSTLMLFVFVCYYHIISLLLLYVATYSVLYVGLYSFCKFK